MKLKNRVAIVTGSAQGIGLAIATRLCEEGAKVIIADLNDEKAAASSANLNKKGFETASVSVNVSDVASLENMVEFTNKTFGGVDILVNNAGILHSTPIPDVTEKEWDTVMEVNLKSVFFATQKALPYLKESKYPRVINISSLAGRMGGFETGLAYSASKGGIISLTYGFARQLSPFGITVNAVCPGTTKSAIIEQWSEAQINGLLARIPLGRLGDPTDIGASVAFLASDDGAFITGLLLDVNGGMYFG